MTCRKESFCYVKSSLVLLASVWPHAYGFAGPTTTPKKCSPAINSLAELQAIEVQQQFVAPEMARWYFTPQGTERKGVALVLHGLNLKPSRMEPLAQALAGMGIDALRGALAGHGGGPDAMRHANAEQWLAEAFLATCEATQRATALKVPFYFVGYSLGALVFVSLQRHPDYAQASVASQVFLAPALAVKPVAHLVRLLQPFPWLGIPSANHVTYRASPTTSVGAYSALWEMLDTLHAEPSKIYKGTDGPAVPIVPNVPIAPNESVPTLVIMDPDDKLVSLSGIEKFRTARALPGWSFLNVSNAEGTLESRSHHLIIDPESVGKKQWQIMIDAIKAQLSVKKL